jgi:hypothetical protein
MRFALPLASLAAVAGLAAPLLAHAFTDIDASTHAGMSVQALQSQGLVQGYADGSFRPGQYVNRAELLKVLMQASSADVSGMPVPCFADFHGAAQWFWPTACAAKSLGIVNGYADGSFRGASKVNQAEALKMAVSAFGLPLPQYFRAPDHWYEPYYVVGNAMHVFDWMPSDPARLLTRVEMAELVAAFQGNGNGIIDDGNGNPPAQALCSNGHTVGDSYPSTDGCNSCSCTQNGEICTLRACAEPQPYQSSCVSDSQCGGGTVCSTRYGDCQSACAPDAQMCAQVCAGSCVAPR